MKREQARSLRKCLIRIKTFFRWFRRGALSSFAVPHEKSPRPFPQDQGHRLRRPGVRPIRSPSATTIPTRSIDGKTMKEHLRFSIAYWHSFRGVGADPFGPGTIVAPVGKGHRPGLHRARRAWMRPLSSSRRSARRSSASTTATSRPRAARSPSRTAISTRSSPTRRRCRRPPASSCSGAPPTCSPTRATCAARRPIPTPHVFAYAAAQVKKALEVTKELGGENYVFWGGREGYETLLNTNLKREQDHLAPLPAHGGRLREEDRLQGPVPHRAQAEGADQAPVRLRRRQRHRLPAHLRPGEAFQVQHRDQPRDARRPHLPARDRGRRGPGHARLDRRQRAATCCSAGTPTSSTPT